MTEHVWVLIEAIPTGQGTPLMVALFLGVSISVAKTFLDLQWSLNSSYSIPPPPSILLYFRPYILF